MVKTEYRVDKDLKRHTIMSDEEMRYINDCIAMLNDNVGHMQDRYTQWEKEETAYASEQDEIAGLPNSRVNIINAAVEGEVSQIVNPNLSVTAKGVSPEDDEFATWGRISLDWAFLKNKITKKLREHERTRNKFGCVWLKLVWNTGFAGGQGLPELKLPSINKVFVDTKVSSHLDLQDAEYIAETINLSKSYAIMNYGKEKAELIDYGFNQYRDNGVFQEDISTMDERNWTLIQWWSKPDGILRLQEFSACGVLLFDSHREGTRKTQDKNSAHRPKSYYRYVDNKYPYFFTIKYSKLGELYGFGDARLSMSMQNGINELYDKIRIQMRPNIILIDSNSSVDVHTFDDNSFSPVFFDGTKIRGQQPIYSVPWGNIASDVWKLLDNFHKEAQRIIRFSDLMTGQRGETQTATEAAIQQSQGNSHSDTEKMVLESTLGDVALYMLALMMEFFKGAKAFRLQGEKSKYEWVDFEKMRNVPALQPATQSYIDKYKKRNPSKPIPEWTHVTDENGKPVTKHVELDIEVSIGSGLPKNKAFIWQMVEKLSQIMSIDTSTGQPQQKPLLNYKELREFIKTYLGIPIQDNDEMEEFMNKFRSQQQQVQQQQQGQSSFAQANVSPMPGGMENTEGLGPGGGPMTSLSKQGGVPVGNSQTA
jgi:hypothetical protein